MMISAEFFADLGTAGSDRKYREVIPASINEMRAEKDHLCAEFAMSTKRLEIALEAAKAKRKKHDGFNRHSLESPRYKLSGCKNYAGDNLWFLNNYFGY
jgi:hypothetical protein